MNALACVVVLWRPIARHLSSLLNLSSAAPADSNQIECISLRSDKYQILRLDRTDGKSCERIICQTLCDFGGDTLEQSQVDN
jgi:hypothetical protein